MEPQIQYTKTSDGVSIAYYAMGEGTPIVLMNLPNSHLQMEWQMSDVRQGYENVARFSTFVRYDHRGLGLSDRDVSDFSVGALLLDLQAVVDRLKLKRFNLVAYGISSPAAIAFAAAHPDRVLKLVLWPGIGRLPDTLTEPIGKLLVLDESQWEFVTESLMRLGQGWADETSGPAAATFRESVTRDTLLEFWRQAQEWDVTNLLDQVVAPTLLVQETRERQFGPEIARELATAIPNARVAILDGATRPERLVQAATTVFPFLLGQQPAAQQEAAQRANAAPMGAHGTAIILFADIVDSTVLTEKLGDAAFREKARGLDSALRAIIRDNGGTPIEGKLLGDGVLATFSSASQAIAAALACGKAEDGGLPLHLGLHVGDVIREDNNVFGGAVNVAARISGLSAAGEVLVSDVVRSLARTSAGVSFEDRGEQMLKGVGEAVRIWAVVEGG
jgi:class 3 adenylate cyclase/pimeloyl-ACP methyl ester carboxylesterase